MRRLFQAQPRPLLRSTKSLSVQADVCCIIPNVAAPFIFNPPWSRTLTAIRERILQALPRPCLCSPVKAIVTTCSSSSFQAQSRPASVPLPNPIEYPQESRFQAQPRPRLCSPCLLFKKDTNNTSSKRSRAPRLCSPTSGDGVRKCPVLVPSAAAPLTQSPYALLPCGKSILLVPSAATPLSCSQLPRL